MKAEEFYQKVKEDYKGNGVSFERYEDAFEFAEAYHKARVEAISDEDISKLGAKSIEFQPKGYVNKTIGEVVGESYAKALKNKLLNN